MTIVHTNTLVLGRKNCGFHSILMLALLGAFAGCSSDSAREGSLAASHQAVFASIPYRGVNLASAEFGADVWGGGTFPGTYGSTYIYPSISEADYYIAKGMNTFRIPFRWERLQRTLNGTLDATESSNLTTTVNGLTAKGAYVIIDPHNYGRYMTNIIGSTAVTNANFADFWTKLANLLKGNSRVIFAVMNEPHDMTSTEAWVTSANAAISAIRSTGATQLILVQGYHWSGAHAWSRSDVYGTANAVAMLYIADSGHNFAYEVHQYLDADFPGTSDQCQSTTIGSQSLQNFTDWLTAHNFKGFLSEFGGGRNSTCYAAISDELNHIKQHPNQYLGWTYWAGGPWWGDYILTLEPSNGQDRPQMASITPYLSDGSGGAGGAAGTGGARATGGSANGGATSTGGRTGTGGANTGGAKATGGKANGGSTSTGGRTGTGGVNPTGGAKATGGAPTGGSTSSGVEPCTPSKTITGGQSGNFNTTGAYCFRTPDTINGWGCSNFDGRSVQVNDVAKTCGNMPMPTKYNGYYYFESSAGTYAWASIYWW